MVCFSIFSGGVLTPAAAFAGTSLIERLDEHGVKFSVIKCEVDSAMWKAQETGANLTSIDDIFAITCAAKELVTFSNRSQWL